MRLHSFVNYIARDMIRQEGTKEVLKNENMIYGIIVQALIKIDETCSRRILSHEEYAMKALQSSIIEETRPLIDYIYTNHGKRNWDSELKDQERKEILQNSIDAIKPTIQDLKENYKYEEFMKRSDELKIADDIIENLETKLEDNEEIAKIFESLSRLEMHFWIEDLTGKKIYPLVSDLLEDIIVLEFALDTDKKLIKKILESWDEAVIAQKERDFFNYTAYTKMEFIKEMKYRNLRKYLLAEYERTLNVQKKNLQKFMQHILYYDVSNHKNTPGLNFDITNIQHRPFLLERTKIIIGEPDPFFQNTTE